MLNGMIEGFKQRCPIQSNLFPKLLLIIKSLDGSVKKKVNKSSKILSKNPFLGEF